MNLIITFSGRNKGNCSSIADYIKQEEDSIVDFKKLNIHSCVNCGYECFNGKCCYREDDTYNLYDSFNNYDKVILIVPMYCGNPSSLYFIFNERCQDYFNGNPDKYDDIVKRMYFIGVYGSKEETPDFLGVFEKWFDCNDLKNHILGIERHKYSQNMDDCVINNKTIIKEINNFMGDMGVITSGE